MNKHINLILFDDTSRDNLLPLTFTRPVAELRVGIDTLREKWERVFNVKCSWLTAEYLSKKFPARIEVDNTFVNASIIADANLAGAIEQLKMNELLRAGDLILAYRSAKPYPFNATAAAKPFNEIQYTDNYLCVCHTWDMFTLNEQILCDDFRSITSGRISKKLSSTNTILGTEVFVEEGVKCECAIINSQTGPVYLGRDSEIMEGTTIRGPFALGEHATLKMGTKIYGATTIGPYCKVGGEVNNAIFIGYSSKAHDGFLGNAVIGEWCNLGAGSNNSNLKNNYAKVKLWNYSKARFTDTGLQFCGLIMGDHSKCGINTMFNTGTVVGVSANIFGAGFPRNFIPSFSWGGAGGYMVYKAEKAIETAEIAMNRRNMTLSEEDKEIIYYLFQLAEKSGTISGS
jgi:UDP-N-acetylglucosamine diphosphorylase/glucosamine-1-phosphate N-acetyltransferase